MPWKFLQMIGLMTIANDVLEVNCLQRATNRQKHFFNDGSPHVSARGGRVTWHLYCDFLGTLEISASGDGS
jgi:hypothetical protein